MSHRISVLLLILVTAGSDGSLIESERLVRHLLHKYNPALIPQEAMDGVTQNVTVKFVVMLHDVLGLDTDTGRLHAQLHVQMSWYDYQVTWDPSHYRGQMYLQFPANMLWLPDFTILNGMQAPPSKDTNVKVLSNGTVFWTTPIDVSVTCNYHFRDNLWSCPLHFGSWSYTAQDLDLMAVDRELRIVERLKYDWMMVTKTAKRRDKYRKHTLCCPDEMNISWEYDLIIQKRTRKRGASLG